MFYLTLQVYDCSVMSTVCYLKKKKSIHQIFHVLLHNNVFNFRTEETTLASKWKKQISTTLKVTEYKASQSLPTIIVLNICGVIIFNQFPCSVQICV